VKGRNEPSLPPIIEEEHHRVSSKGWAAMIRKVDEVEPLVCAECGAEMKVIAYIEDHKVTGSIIRFSLVLALWSGALYSSSLSLPKTHEHLKFETI